MKRTLLHGLPALVVAALLALSAGLRAADGLEARTEQLEALRAEIEQVTQSLRADRARESGLDAELARVEREIGEVNAALDQLTGRIDQAQAKIAELRQQYQAQSRRLASQRALLAQQVRAAYMTGREEYLRLLLSQEDPDRIDRMLVYYDYLNQARARRIHEAVALLRELHDLRTRLDARLAQLQSLRSEREARRDTLAQRQSEREAVLAKLRRRIQEGDQRLERLNGDEAHLMALIEQLQRALADIPEDIPVDVPFAERKGALVWPVAGELLASFGSQRFADIRWSGVLIGAEAGAPVRAVSHGRVVFADWLRGLGLLIIIDHGDGYMTLYGHNQSLYKEVGDWVRPGEVIATVGSSGGGRRSALYFEVRTNGEPVDPLAWLRPAQNRG